ncbi:MAG: DUF2474 family protein [Pseudomonadota bacterium]
MKARRWLSRFGWLLAIWAASVAALALAAWLMRLLMRAVGMQ